MINAVTEACLPENNFVLLRKVSLVTRDATLAVKVKADLVIPVQYQYTIPRYLHARPLKTSVLKCKSRYISAVCRIQTGVDGVSVDGRTRNLT